MKSLEFFVEEDYPFSRCGTLLESGDVDPWPEYFRLRTLGNSAFLSWISLVCEWRKKIKERERELFVVRNRKVIIVFCFTTNTFLKGTFVSLKTKLQFLNLIISRMIKTESATINNPSNYRDVYNNVLFFLLKIGLYCFHLGNLRNVTRSDAICLVNVG